MYQLTQDIKDNVARSEPATFCSCDLLYTIALCTLLTIPIQSKPECVQINQNEKINKIISKSLITSSRRD